MTPPNATWFATQDPKRVTAAIDRLRLIQPDWIIKHNNDDFYALWMRLVDGKLRTQYGIGVTDLADFNSYDCYADGLTPTEGAQIAIESDDLYCTL